MALVIGNDEAFNPVAKRLHFAEGSVLSEPLPEGAEREHGRIDAPKCLTVCILYA